MSSEPTLPLRHNAPATSSVTNESGVALSKRILVLGATSGIAEACCRLWAERGETLYLVARNADKLASVAADLRTRGAVFVETAVADLDNTALHPELLAHAINALGGLDVAFVSLGVLGQQPKAERNFNDAAQIIHTNFVAAASLLTWLGNYCAQRHCWHARGSCRASRAIEAVSPIMCTAPRRRD